MLLDDRGKLHIPEVTLEGWSLGFVGPKTWEHLKSTYGVKGPDLTEGTLNWFKSNPQTITLAAEIYSGFQ